MPRVLTFPCKCTAENRDKESYVVIRESNIERRDTRHRIHVEYGEHRIRFTCRRFGKQIEMFEDPDESRMFVGNLAGKGRIPGRIQGRIVLGHN